MSQEFPKGLSKGDEWVIVFSAEEEAMARTNGYRFYRDEDEPQAEPKKRPGRPPKAKE
jgi:hypothetical protein